MRVQRRLCPKTGANHVVRVGPDELDFQDDISRTRNASIVASTMRALRLPSIRVRDHPPIASPPEMVGTRSGHQLLGPWFHCPASSPPRSPNLPFPAAA